MKTFTIPIDLEAIHRGRGLTPPRKARPRADRPRTPAYLIAADGLPVARVRLRAAAVHQAERLARDWSPPPGTLAFGRPARVQVFRGSREIASFVCP